jgi:drug/metabolite transporter (DMT)-like permease
LALNVFCLGLVYTSATLGAATTNCLPVTTFLFAVLLRYFPATFSYPHHIEFFLLLLLTTVHLHVLHCRMEKVTIKTIPGIAKVVGLAVCMAGVATLAFYGGPQLNPSIHYPFLGNHDKQQDHQAHTSFGKTWILGCFLLFLSIVSWGLWLVLQVGNQNCSRLVNSPLILEASQLSRNSLFVPDSLLIVIKDR